MAEVSAPPLVVGDRVRLVDCPCCDPDTCPDGVLEGIDAELGRDRGGPYGVRWPGDNEDMLCWYVADEIERASR